MMAKERPPYILLKVDREHLPFLHQLIVHAVERSEYPIDTVAQLIELYKIVKEAEDE
jgi:hypothetical protein